MNIIQDIVVILDVIAVNVLLKNPFLLLLFLIVNCNHLQVQIRLQSYFGRRMKFEIVSPHEMNLEAGKISLKSPIGAALMGRKVGETVEADTPSGKLRLRIESITFE